MPAIDTDMERIIRLQSGLVQQGGFFLAGGTALAIRLGHRLSDDLDWFTATRFEVGSLVEGLKALTEKPTTVRQDGRQTVRAYYGLLETSFIGYEQVPSRPEFLTVKDLRIPIADIELLAAMKAAAAHDRGARRDLIDVHAIAQLPGWSVGRFIEHGARSLPLDERQIARAITFFVDADRQPMPKGCKVPWEKVKEDLSQGVREWERARDRGLDL
jgi:hypothetical protein